TIDSHRVVGVAREGDLHLLAGRRPLRVSHDHVTESTGSAVGSTRCHHEASGARCRTVEYVAAEVHARHAAGLVHLDQTMTAVADISAVFRERRAIPARTREHVLAVAVG